MTPGRERQARLRQRRQTEGLHQVTVWLDGESLARLAAVRQRGEHDSAVVRRALQALAAEHNRAIEEEIRTIEARHRAIQERVSAMYYEGQLTARQIANRLNKAGVPVGANGGRWDEDIVAGFLVTNWAVSDWSVIDARLTPAP